MQTRAALANRGWRTISFLMKPIYEIYEKKLEAEISKDHLPKHVAIIPDGNRRWARMRGLQEWLGHREGYKKMREVLMWLLELGIEVVTVFAMSTENCTRRSPEEREKLYELIAGGLRELAKDEIVHRNEVKVMVIGRRNLWPKELLEAAKEVEEATKGYNKRVINVAVCYGGRQEIVDAVRKIAWKVKRGELEPDQIDENVITQHLYTENLPDPDLIIRTSGEERISNFLLWQSAYSELYFANIYWPEIRRIDILRALRDYQRRQRRFGR
ncbi:polyprenyl diphosphate synthase [Ignicoccus hospitalis]|uniref:Tritrans,polycis-undecaprenyl-diphosphate synthase (geranylgeranyl-diphosphate specific) n=1 Tax=Ignicoccus hospitalis (strain KIN4/I / DSM 18386 / JCM 14125) TaxID=453591 RepID=A8AA16_IGNH4|nr:polyprenyl diphosphate synthase [Ignicoccus hospitalis]ABU81768.1 Undecaprenyl pyrophosphate synthetase [Ignicoccus hospitalis KIN4/I]